MQLKKKQRKKKRVRGRVRVLRVRVTEVSLYLRWAIYLINSVDKSKLLNKLPRDHSSRTVFLSYVYKSIARAVELVDLLVLVCWAIFCLFSIPVSRCCPMIKEEQVLDKYPSPFFFQLEQKTFSTLKKSF